MVKPRKGTKYTGGMVPVSLAQAFNLRCSILQNQAVECHKYHFLAGALCNFLQLSDRKALEITREAKNYPGKLAPDLTSAMEKLQAEIANSEVGTQKARRAVADIEKIRKLLRQK